MKIFVTLAGITLCMFFTTQSFAQKINEKRIQEFCEAKERAYPGEEGVQFNGEKAHSWVMGLEEGQYNINQKAQVILFKDNYYLVVLSKSIENRQGSDGDDLIFGSNVLAGCSLEQLSEVLKNNSVLASEN